MLAIAAGPPSDRLSRIGVFPGPQTDGDQAQARTERSAQAPATIRLSAMDAKRRGEVLASLDGSFLTIGDRVAPCMKSYEQARAEGTPWELGSDDAAFKALGLCWMLDTVFQAAGEDRYLVFKGNWMLVVPGNTTLVDGARVYGVAVTNGVYEFTTVLGANKRVPCYRMVAYTVSTPDEVLAFFEKGGAARCTLPVQETCPACRGYRSVKRTDGRMGSDPCAKCSGTGKVTYRLWHMVSW